MGNIDEIGLWTEIKHDIIKRYATEYSKIITKQNKFDHYYIDAFSGAGVQFSKNSGKLVKGSPLIALDIKPPFKKCVFIDLKGDKKEILSSLVGDRIDAEIITGDCNLVLKEILPQIKYEEYKRALCLLDPYGLHLDWEVINIAGRLKTIEIFINFPIMDINMNVVRDYPSQIDESQLLRMDRYWGDRSWHEILYSKTPDLFDTNSEARVDTASKGLVNAFVKRLKSVAGFKYVPNPVPMRNNSGGILYFLIFASYNQTGKNIVEYIFEKYRKQGTL